MASHALAAGRTLDSSGLLRFFTIFLLYAGQGIPIGLFDFAIPAWMAVNGASAQDIAFIVAMIGIPWSFKFIAGAIMDRYTLLAMGRRRAWIIGAQAMMVSLLVLFAIIDPGPRDVLVLGLVALAVSTATMFQDVAVDALAIDILREAERSMGGSLASGGQVIGIAISAALTGAMVYAYGASAAYATCAALVLVVTVHVIWTRERTGERRLPWSRGEPHEANLAAPANSWLPLIRATLRNTLSRYGIAWFPILLVKGLTYGVCVVAVPLIATGYAGWAEDRIGSINGTAQLVAGITTIAVGGLAVKWMGAQHSLRLMYMASIAFIGWMWWSSGSWADPRVVVAFIFGWTMLHFLGGIGVVVINMRLSPPTIAASQFSIWMAFHNMGISLAGILISSIPALADAEAMLLLLIGSQALAVLILLAVRFPTRQVDLAPASRKIDPAPSFPDGSSPRLYPEQIGS